MIRKHQKGEGEMFSNPVDRFFFLVHKISVKIVKKGVGGGGGDIGLSDIYRVSVFHNLWQALYISWHLLSWHENWNALDYDSLSLFKRC